MHSFLAGILTDYQFDPSIRCWIPNSGLKAFDYSDGDEVEKRIYNAVLSVDELNSVSTELRQHIIDWPSKYHFSSLRGNLLRPFSALFKGRVLEVGAGCGAITRYLGECGGEVLAIEGSHIRAVTAAARCRDLANVNVLVDAFHRLPPRPIYDVVTLVGVLEYARKYFPTKNADPVDALIGHASSFLKPNGVVIVAIENQLGLKYFAGYKEDHVGVPMFGIEDRYNMMGVATFGQHELQKRLFAADLVEQSWWFPFPDYKLPTVVASGEALSATWAARFQPVIESAFKSDPQQPPITYFMLERAWKAVTRNGLGAALANSFLIIAGKPGAITAIQSPSLVYYYASDRKAEYAKTIEFCASAQGDIVVHPKKMFPNQEIIDNYPIKMSLFPQQEEFFEGLLWSQKLTDILQIDGWGIKELVDWSRVWYDAILGYISPVEEGHILPATYLLPGKLFDAIPKNLIIQPDGRAIFIDQEWTINLPLELGFLLFRAVFTGLMAVGKVARPEPGTLLHGVSLLRCVASSLGIRLSEADIVKYCEFEGNVQNWVSGRSGPLLEDILSFSLKVSVQSEQLIAIDRLVVDYDEQIAGLKQGLAARDEQIASYGQLEEKLQFTMDQAAILSSKFNRLEKDYYRVIQSKSWRYTIVIRYIFRLFKSNKKSILQRLRLRL